MTKAEWKEQYRQQRLDLQASSDELSKLPQLQNKLKGNIEKMLTGRGYSSVPANR